MSNRRFQGTVLGAIAIAALIVAAFRIGRAFNGPAASPPTGSGAIAVDASNNVGIGISAPSSILHVLDTAATVARGIILDEVGTVGPNVNLRRAEGTPGAPTAVRSGDNLGTLIFSGYVGGSYGTFNAFVQAIAAENFSSAAQGTDMRFSTTPIGGATFSERMRILAGGNVGIGTSAPQALLSVGTTTSGLVAIFGGGSGKINAGTIDPVYRIGGEQYATYLPGMTGVKEETTGVLSLAPAMDGVWSAVIDFAREPRGSDLWLFSKVTDLKRHFSLMTVLLTPAFDGTAWYEKDATNQRLIVHAKQSLSSVISHRVPLEVSYRLTAPRFDASSWPNLNRDGGSTGFVIGE